MPGGGDVGLESRVLRLGLLAQDSGIRVQSL